MAGLPPAYHRHVVQTETETRLSPTGRVEAFSDGVMAIAITVLVLDLKVPPLEDVANG